MRINLIYNFWDKIFLHENLQSGSLYLDQCSACITTLPIEQLFWKGKSTIVCLERQSWFYSIIHCITWTSIQIKRKALIVHASVSVLLLCCNPFWYTDVWTLLIHFPGKFISLFRYIIRDFGFYNHFSYFRLEKLCPPDGRKVRMRQEENVSSFQLNSSLVPGHVFNCHLELVLTQPDSGEK